MNRRSPLWLLPALALLNAALSFDNLWPTPWIAPRPEVSVEAAAVVLALCAAVAWRGATPSPGRVTAVAVLLTVLCVGRYLEVTAPALYGRPINLYWDAQHLPRVVAMVVDAVPAWMSAAALSGLLALLAGVFLALRLAVRWTTDALCRPWTRRLTAAGCAALVLAWGTGMAGAGTLGWFSVPVLFSYAGQAKLMYAAVRERGAPAVLDAPPLPPSRLDGVAGADVVLLFVESYGAATYDRREVAARMLAPRAALARAAAAGGHDVVSAFVTSPTFGGASWLAHSSLLSGLPVGDAATYQHLLGSARETLVTRFATAGYRTVAMMPGLKRAWPEGGFYGFDRIYGEAAVGYHGPAFGWWRVPDQFALARLDAEELAAPERRPVFAFFPTVSSHMPFRPTPPYQPQWRRLLGRAPFAPDAVAASLSTTPDWLDLAPAYADALAYSLTVVAGYLDWRRDADRVLVLLGDHQPAASVSGPGASREVPVHVVTAHRGVLHRLREAGFEDGLYPRRRELMPLHALAPLLLAAFERSVGSPQSLAAAGPGERAPDPMPAAATR
jgi:hypothetical protein